MHNQVPNRGVYNKKMKKKKRMKMKIG